MAFWDCVLLALLCGDRIICVAVLEKKEEWSAQKSPLSINGAHHNQACHRVAASLLFALLTPRAGIAYNCRQPGNNFNAIVLGINVLIACRTVHLLGANLS